MAQRSRLILRHFRRTRMEVWVPYPTEGGNRNQHNCVWLPGDEHGAPRHWTERWLYPKLDPWDLGWRVQKIETPNCYWHVG